MLYGYANAFEGTLDKERQFQALAELGVARDRCVVEVRYSLGPAPQPQLRALLDALRAGDVLVTPQINRLAGSLALAHQCFVELAERSVGIQVGRREFAAGSPALSTMIDTIAMVLEDQHYSSQVARKVAASVRELRTQDGDMPVLRTRMTAQQQERLMQMHTQGELSTEDLAKAFDSTVETIERTLAAYQKSDNTVAPETFQVSTRGRKRSLTLEQEQSLLALYATREYTQAGLADLFDISPSTVKRIIADDRATK